MGPFRFAPLTIAFVTDGRPPISKRAVLYLRSLLLLAAVVGGWISLL